MLILGHPSAIDFPPHTDGRRRKYPELGRRAEHMTPERWERVQEIFTAALGRVPAERVVFLDEACRGDGDMRREVESLLASDADASSSSSSPPRSRRCRADRPARGRRDARTLGGLASARTKSSRRSAQAEWARSTERETRASGETSRSRFCPRSFPPTPIGSGASRRRPAPPPPSTTRTSSPSTTSERPTAFRGSRWSTSTARRCGRSSPAARCRRRSFSTSRPRSPRASPRRTKPASCIGT